MADIAITAANVELDKTSTRDFVQFGEAVSPSMSVYLNSTDNKWYKAKNNGTVDQSKAQGLSVNKVSANGWGYIVKKGPYKPGATVVLGETYYVSSTFGGICPSADITSGKYVTPLGVAIATDAIDLNPQASGVLRA
jgi:hypothetical protein